MELKFKSIENDDIDIIRKYLIYNTYNSCDYTLGILYMWRDELKYSYCVYKECLIIKALVNNKVMYYYPLGERNKEVAKDLGLVEYFSLPEETLNDLNDMYEVEDIYSRDYSDYLYDASSLASLVGKSNSKHRNHVNKFKKLYPDYVFKEVSDEEINEVHEFLENYHKRGESSPSSNYELSADKKIVSLYKQLGLTMCEIKYRNKIIALTMGEIINDCLYVHIEKGFTSYEGVYPTINQEFASYCKSKNGIKYINREDDSGDIGLRTSKTNYHPLKMVNKYDVKIIKEK